MDRNRDARRGNMAAVNGLSRRRPRSGSLRDSPEEDGGVVEMQESTRLRDRGGKKDRDRDRSSRSKRRRGDHMMHGSNREEGEDSTDESIDEEEEEDDEDSGAAVRLHPPPPPPSNPSPPSSALPANHNHRKSLPTKVIRPPPVWKVADEMIGVSVPRKARSASAKRSPECWVSGSSGGTGGGGEHMHRQTSTSPSRPSQAASVPAPISPSSSNASVRKKTKQICGTKQRPPKISKSASSIKEIEFEVAEVLYGLTRQFQASANQESQVPDSKDANGSCAETKARPPSPNPISPSPSISQSLSLPPQNFSSTTAVAPKRKRPRPVKFEDETPTSPSNQSVSVPASSTSKAADVDQLKMDVPSPKFEKAASTSAENGGASLDLCSRQVEGTLADAHEESKKPEVIPLSEVKASAPELVGSDRGETEEELSAAAKDSVPVEFDANDAEAIAVKIDSVAECPREKIKIDLMAPPPGKSSPERDSDFAVDDKSPMLNVEMGSKMEPLHGEDRTVKQETREAWREDKGDKCSQEGHEVEKPIKKETSFDLQLEIEKHDKDGISISKQPGSRQQSKVARAEPKPDKPAQAGSLPLPVPVAGWPGGLPFGYVGQVPPLQPVVPMDGNSVAPKSLPAQHFLSQQLRPKRCATHCYIAQNIYYHQQLARINPFWPAATGSSSLYGGKSYNLNVMPTTDSAVLSNPLQACFPGRGIGALPDKVAPAVGSFPNHSTKDKLSAANFVDAAQRKQLVLQQPLQAGSTSNMLPAPAFIFPLNQPQAAVAATANSRTAHVKPSNMSVASASSGSGTAVVSSGSTATPAPAVSFNYPNLPQGEAQYLVLQNHGYPFPIPAHVGAPSFRGGNHTQAMPFFSGSLYASQMLHPSQLQQQQPLHPPPAQQVPQNASTSTGSSSSQKHPQHSQKTPVGNASGTDGMAHGPPTSKQRQQLPPHQQARQLDNETASEDSPSTADSRLSQKGVYNHNFVMPLNTPPSQTFAMSFASFNGPAASGHHGLDFSAAAQNHAIFQSLPDMARHGYQLSAPAAAAQAAQHKKSQQQHPEGGKFFGESVNVNLSAEEERKAMLAGKASSGISQHSLSFSRPDNDPSGSAVVGNSVIDSSTRTLNLIPASVNGGLVHGRPTSTTSAAVTASPASGGSLSAQQQQQHLIQLQKQHQQQPQQQLQMQQQVASRAKPSGTSNNASVYSDRLSAGTTMPKFQNPLSGFPQALIQPGNQTQSPQWKNSARNSTSMPSPAPNAAPQVKSHLPQQQGRTPPSHSNVGLHSQISFGMNSMKPSPVGQQQQLAGANSIQTSISVSAAASSVGSPPTSKQQQQFQPAQIFFTNSYLPSQTAAATAAATAGYHQRRASEQQSQPNSPSISSGMLSLCAPALTLAGTHAATSDPAKAVAAAAAAAANSVKGGLPSPSLLQAAQFAAAHPAPGSAHTLMSAAGFPYFHAVPSVSVKPAEQKPAAGNDTLHACWQPEKR
ncbi:hypothetical protein Taro_051239 [Colocasia esculenta]|uniref:Protein TIME FOR COFFEE n=1 Tax=Colocasia esculenta TaxID=4460 RepID=A0A843XG98_COLES|nr:hypothetical protein [Colocasia esculenta]